MGAAIDVKLSDLANSEFEWQAKGYTAVCKCGHPREQHGFGHIEHEGKLYHRPDMCLICGDVCDEYEFGDLVENVI